MSERADDTHSWAEIAGRADPVWDPAFGAGRRLPITPGVHVEVYEAVNLTQVAAPDIRVELFGPARPHLADERVVYEQTSTTGSLHLELDRDGTVILQRSAPPARAKRAGSSRTR